jgi:hypothetical protein
MEFTRADDAHLRAAVAMIKHGQEVGTAFFTAPGLLVTCEHVVKGATAEDLTVAWAGEVLEVVRIVHPPSGSTLDLALIEVTIKEHPVVVTGPAATIIGPVYSYGFQYSERGYFGYPSYGTLAGSVREGNTGSGRELLHIVDALIAPGLSGAPLLSVIEKRVIGVVKRNRPERGGYAVPIEQAVELNPNFFSLSSPQANARQSPMASYFRRLAAEHEFVSLLDLNRALRLDDIFVSLTLTRSGMSGQRLAMTTGGAVSVSTRVGLSLRTARRDRGGPQRFAEDQAVSLFDVISHSKAIIIGEPGCGKTTLLRHIVSRTCKGELLRDRVPIFIKLSDIEVGVGCIEDWLRVAQSHASDALLKALETGSVLLLLDGFDESPRGHHGMLVREIERLAASGNQVLVTCRSVSLPRGLFSSDFRIFECIGFNVSQQKRFLRQWFAESLERAARLERQINNHAGVLGFARNPLLLSLMAVVAENEHGFALPVNRTALYEKAIWALFERRAPSTRSDLSARRKFAIIKRVAFSNFVKGREIFTENTLLKGIEAALKDQRGVDPETVLHDLVEVDGVLALHSSQRYRFLHLTFQEFLTAQSLVDSGDYQLILGAAIDEPRWEEVIRLTCGLMDADHAAALVRKIWNGETGRAGVGRLLLAARAASDCLSLGSDHVASLATGLLRAMEGNDRPNQLFEVEDALASLCRTHTGLLERSVAPSARGSSDSQPSIGTESLIRLMGMTADSYSAAALRSIWGRISALEGQVNETNLALAGRVLEAIGQARLEDVTDGLVDALYSRSNYIRSAAARTLVELQPAKDREMLLTRLYNGENDEKGLVLGLLCSFQDRRLSSHLFETVFKGSNKALQKAFAFHFNRTEIELDPDLVASVWKQASDKITVCHILSMHRCFLDPVLFSRLKLAAFTADSDTAPRSAAISTLMRIDSEVIPELVRGAVAESSGNVDAFRSILAAAPSSRAEVLARSILEILNEPQRRQNASAILRFVVANRVSRMKGWVESLAVDDSPSSVMRQCLLALAALASPTFIDYARRLLGDTASSGIPNRIIAYRGLGLMVHPTAREILLDRLAEEADQAVVTEIIHALGQHGDSESTAALLRLLRSDQWPPHWPPPEAPRRQGDQRPSDRRRLSIIFALEQGMNPSAAGPLAEVAAEATENDLIREAAMIASRNIEWGSGIAGEQQ